MTLEEKRKIKQYEAMLDALGDKGLRALDNVSQYSTQKKLDDLFQAVCTACEDDPDLEAEFGELAGALEEVTHFLRRHPSMLKKVG